MEHKHILPEHEEQYPQTETKFGTSPNKTGVTIISKNSLGRRILNIFKNPLTYLLHGRVEY